MKILITGGAGFIGSHTVELLASKGHDICVLDNFSTGLIDNVCDCIHGCNGIVYEGDITVEEDVREVFESFCPDAVIHLAANGNLLVSVDRPKFDAETNIIGTINILNACRRFDTKRVVLASSGGCIYGDHVLVPTEESTSTFPMSPYGVSKLASEHYARLYEQLYDLPCITLRYANVYGPRQTGSGERGVVAIFMEKLLDNKRCVFYGDGRQTRDFVYVGDVAEANLLAVESQYRGVLNIGTGVATTIVNLYNKISSLVGLLSLPEILDAKPGEQRQSVLACNAAETTIGWKAKTPLSKGLYDSVLWYKQMRNDNA